MTFLSMPAWAFLQNGNPREKMDVEEWKWCHWKYSSSWHFFSNLVFTPFQQMLTLFTDPWAIYRHFHYKAPFAWMVLEVFSEECNFKIIDKLFLMVLGEKNGRS